MVEWNYNPNAQDEWATEVAQGPYEEFHFISPQTLEQMEANEMLDKVEKLVTQTKIYQTLAQQNKIRRDELEQMSDVIEDNIDNFNQFTYNNPNYVEENAEAVGEVGEKLHIAKVIIDKTLSALWGAVKATGSAVRGAFKVGKAGYKAATGPTTRVGRAGKKLLGVGAKGAEHVLDAAIHDKGIKGKASRRGLKMGAQALAEAAIPRFVTSKMGVVPGLAVEGLIDNASTLQSIDKIGLPRTLVRKGIKYSLPWVGEAVTTAAHALPYVGPYIPPSSGRYLGEAAKLYLTTKGWGMNPRRRRVTGKGTKAMRERMAYVRSFKRY